MSGSSQRETGRGECIERVWKLQEDAQERVGEMFLRLKRPPSPEELRADAEWMTTVIEIGRAITGERKLTH